MYEEYYSIPRSILESSHTTQKVYFHLLLHGNDGTMADLARALKISRQELRTALKNIDKQPMPNQSLTKAQPTNTTDVQSITGGLQPTPNQRPTKGQPKLGISEENKEKQYKRNIREEEEKKITPIKKKPLIEVKKKIPLKERREAFYESLVPYVEEFGKAMVREFYDYWSEPYQNVDKFRMEGEKTWDTHRRLLTWQKRDEAARARNNGLALGQVLHNNKNKEYEGW